MATRKTPKGKKAAAVPKKKAAVPKKKAPAKKGKPAAARKTPSAKGAAQGGPKLSKQKAAELAAKLRRPDVLKSRLLGVPMRILAERYGVSIRTIGKDETIELERVTEETSADVLELLKLKKKRIAVEDLRLDQSLQGVNTMLYPPAPKDSKKKAHQLSDKDRLKALDLRDKIGERRRKLHGLDGAVKIDVTDSTESEERRELREALARLGQAS